MQLSYHSHPIDSIAIDKVACFLIIDFSHAHSNQVQREKNDLYVQNAASFFFR